MMKCKKAIIALGGYGGRRVPITKALEKCMIPIGNRPIVDYLVDDCIAAGITDIIFVVGEQSDQIRTYYGHNQALEDYLVKNHKLDALETVSNLKTKARFHFITQHDSGPRGTTVPLWMAKDYIRPDESFLYLYGDNILHSQDGSSGYAEFISETEGRDLNCAMMVNEVPHENVHLYGIVATEKRDGIELFKYIHEKPSVEEAPSNLNNSGVFYLNYGIFDYAKRNMEQPTTNKEQEHYVIDVINSYHNDKHDVGVFRTKAEWLDCGSVEGWLYANNRIISSQAD
jgi:UTP--glucose-1-phosphate uridylyltransferase